MRDYEILRKALMDAWRGQYCSDCELNSLCQDDDSNCWFKQAADAIEELFSTCEHYRIAADDWFKEACDYKEKLAKCEEELQRLKTTDTVYGYPVNELIAFAAACRENGVEEKDLKTFANNVRFAFEIVHAEAEAAFQRAMWGIGEKGVK